MQQKGLPNDNGLFEEISVPHSEVQLIHFECLSTKRI